MCLLGKVKELRLEHRRIRCPDQFRARTSLELRRGENRLGHGCEFGEEGEQSCLYQVRARMASGELEQVLRKTVDLPIIRTS